MSSLRFFMTTAVAAVAMMAIASPPAFAQAADAEPPAQATPQITDQQLETYAVAALEVQKINQTYQPKINQAPTMEEQKVLYDKATQEMTEAIQGSGLSVEQYNQITALVQSNPDLSKQVQGYMDKTR